MTVSTRSYLIAGAAAMVVGAMAIAPIQPSAPASITMDTVRLSAAVQPLVNQVNTAAVTLGQAAPAAAVQQPQAQKAAQANNNVSNAIDAAYGVIMYWSNYLALELGPYLLGWIPFGYLISDQIYIWYPNFTVPVADAFVYNFLDPVVNDFWNPTVWRDGLTAIANATRVGLGTVVQQEIAYAWSLAWFPFPLPPLPPLPFAATKVAAAAASTAAAAPAKAAVTSGTGHSARPQVARQSADTVTAAAVADTTDATPGASRTAKADSTDSTSGKSGSATSGSDAPKKKSTAGSARNHKAAD
ncbi:conserved exported hypothetical protein [uncultured Mycobacterium sp.]|uniref:PE family protein n=1 Tax=uncultured Mycobacterium sp. TaxID=171292 RepID=A0A1Y5PGD9_9MYCO|nr:conserved exported hypothetical protein [uncultured Mycobacterium sp.]